MTREEDRDLVMRLRSEDETTARQAFEELYLEYKDRVYNTACRILHDPGHAADVTQETFLVIVRKAGKFDFRSAFSSWIYRLAVNLCIDARRKRNRRRPLSLSEPEVAAWAGEADRRREEPLGPDDAVELTELQATVAKAIAALNPKLSAVVVLRYLEGLEYDAIAEALGLPLGTVKSRLNRAHAALEVQLGPAFSEYTRGIGARGDPKG